MQQVSITLENGEKMKIKHGTTILSLMKELDMENDKSILAAYLDNKMKELNTKIEHDVKIRFVPYNTIDGGRVYQRSCAFIMTKAFHDIYPKADLRILHSVPQGLYCELFNGPKLTPAIIKKVETRMKEIVKKDVHFTRDEMPIERAIALFKKGGREDKARLLGFRAVDNASVYRLEDDINYFFGNLAPSTGYIKTFELKKYENGLLLRLPDSQNMKKLSTTKNSLKLFHVFKETFKWRQILGVTDVGSLNEVITSGRSDEYVLCAEAFHEKKIASIADLVAKKKDVKVILISGPSSSGKTTFTKRLSIQLRVAGLQPKMISMDDFFVDREKTPIDENGEHDFESPYALNIKLFKDCVKKIVANKPVELPRYDFKAGKSGMSGETMVTTKENVILIEGIHALNPLFSEGIPRKNIFKIYVSALTQVPLDSHNRIPTTDTRILRRIVRDYQFRNYAANDTILRWPSVRAGETKHIFPYQDEADVLFNTALIYELSALKTMAEPILHEVPHDSKAYAEAHRLLKFLSYFQSIPLNLVPKHSILREFLGGSIFKY